MSLQLKSQQVWQAIEKEIFAVLGMVTAKNEARTVGVVYIVQDHKLYIGTGINSWKARHIAANSAVSITIPIAKRIPIMPWIKIPAATITFSGKARVLPANEAAEPILRAAFRDLADDAAQMSESCLIEVTPEKEFITYGIGIPLRQMRHPDQSRGRAPVV
ncbi:MAG: pyridoxamine 5'-phosphate oxidase family protein [Ardenticatenaceae bacterium]|nr:pyridoxamine 5'-phosphate oxidase family protein [Ardenticatenaceae bacterium]MCB8946489.1 pyridoxamine 5'-phosphate oxidase family protein [Ardenticatenaceae bacterium]